MNTRLAMPSAADQARQAVQSRTAQADRNARKGGKRPGWKTIQKLRGSQSSQATSTKTFGREVGELVGERDRQDERAGTLAQLSKKRRAKGRQEIDVQSEPTQSSVKGLGAVGKTSAKKLKDVESKLHPKDRSYSYNRG